MKSFKNIFGIVVFLVIEDGIRKAAGTMVYRTIRDTSYRIPDLNKRTPDFIEENGYIAETHSLVTEDNYMLTFHRIMSKNNSFESNEVKSSTSKPVVIFQHGIASASDNWLLSGPKSLPFMLADAGFDVWLPDTRGNSYSRAHMNMTDRDPKFWDFSFHEQAYYDLAACIDYALNITGQKKLIYIGHSRGTTMGFALLSSRPEYNDKIKIMISLAPVAYLKHSKGPILKAFFVNSNPKDIAAIARRARLFSLPGKTTMSLRIRNQFCSNKAATQNLCARFLFLLSGFDHDLMNKTMLPIYYSHFPDGGAIKEFLHYFQIAKSDRFQQYDYGSEDNLRIYGQMQPPRYELEKISAPVALYYADNDYFVSIEDLRHLSKQLKNRVATFRVPFKKFNHIDFMWGTKADVLVYKPLIKFLFSYV